ncbi:MAG: hypothetical protein ACI94Y_004064 [Maribacter sp.]|jgi:hypothetical protein
MLNTKVKENLLRLWESKDIRNHDLAFQMMVGLSLDEEDLLWLWEVYEILHSLESKYVTLRNLSQLSKEDILRGRILSILLEHEIVANRVVSTFYKKDNLRIPYNTLITFPVCLYTYSNIQELTWQDGELKEINENITQFQQLRRLDLRRQPIEFIHPAIADLPLLEEIHLISTSFLPEELSERQDVEIYTDAPY